MKNKMFSAVAGILVVSSVLAVSAPAYASNGWFGGGNFLSGFITFRLRSLGCHTSQVQIAITEYKATITPKPRPTPNPQAMQQREKAQLDKLVSSGKITSAQETAILAELATLQSQYPFTQGATQAQRQTNMQNMQSAWKTWAAANGIDPTLVMPFGGMGGGMGRGLGGRGRGNWKPTPTPTP